MDWLRQQWNSLTGTPTQEQPVVANPSGMTDGVQGGRKKTRLTRRTTKKSRKTKPRRK